MIDTPQIVQTDAKITAVIRLTVPRAEIQKVMGPAIQEVLSAVAKQKLAPAGPLFSRHFRMDPATFDFEVGVPVHTSITPTGRVIAGVLPAERAARTEYRGGYEGLGQAWGEFDAWLKSNGHTPAAGLWESYVTGPETGQPSEYWRTELTRPLVS